MTRFILLPHTQFLSWLYRLGVLLGVLLLGTSAAHAGCGCEKPPPPPASVRPNVTYGGQPVTLFHPSLVSGDAYTVKFTAMDGTAASVTATAVTQRDIADAVAKTQLVVPVPTSLPLGPVGLTVSQAGQPAPFLSIPDTAFTLAPQPIVVPNQVGAYSYQNYQAAVGRDGRTYLSLDITGITMPRTFQAQAQGWPLRFTKDATVFYNVQGFLMQLASAPIPGLFSINSGTATDSDIAQYARHEFNTYLLQHAEHLPHAVDPTDGNWHLDGSRHIDHNHLLLTIAGTVNGAAPAAGATPPFTLALTASSFFENGLVGIDGVSMSKETRTDSFNRRTGVSGAEGDIFSNGAIQLGGKAVVNGNGRGGSFAVVPPAVITGSQTVVSQPTTFLSVSLPTGLLSLGTINLGKNQTRTLIGPASYQVADLLVAKSGQLVVDNTRGPVTLYVTGAVDIAGDGLVTTAEPNAEKFAIYVAGGGPVHLAKAGALYGVVYAPQAAITIEGLGEMFGAFVGKSLSALGYAQIHYDPALRGE